MGLANRNLPGQSCEKSGDASRKPQVKKTETTMISVQNLNDKFYSLDILFIPILESDIILIFRCKEKTKGQSSLTKNQERSKA